MRMILLYGFISKMVRFNKHSVPKYGNCFFYYNSNVFKTIQIPNFLGLLWLHVYGQIFAQIWQVSQLTVDVAVDNKKLIIKIIK